MGQRGELKIFQVKGGIYKRQDITKGQVCYAWLCRLHTAQVYVCVCIWQAIHMIVYTRWPCERTRQVQRIERTAEGLEGWVDLVKLRELTRASMMQVGMSE